MELIAFNQVIFLKEGMARKYYEQMLAEELELRKATSFPRYTTPWYAAPSPLYYGLSNMNQDFRNPTRVNRHDLYSLEYYRQHFWMPQALVFPNYESIYLLRRNNKRFSNARNHLSRDKRSNAEKKFCRQEDIHNCRGERGKTYFLPEFERRYPENWNRDGTHYPISRDVKNASCLTYRNSNFDFCSENMMMEQHLHNIKQMLESRNPSFERLTVNENLPQTGYSRNESLLQADFQNDSYRTTDVEWHDQAGKASNNISFTESSSNNESWYCPEEQQQIVDMLKEVDLRHDRQLKRDILLSRNDQPYSDNESQASDSLQNFSSSEEDEDNINILLYPGGIPPLREAEEEDEHSKSEYYEKNSSNNFEDFQNVFTGSPEKKISNKLTAETMKKTEITDGDFLWNVGRVITDDDKNAVKTVLDFDNVDDLTEKASHECTSPKMSSSFPTVASRAIENKNSVAIVHKQYTNLHEKCSLDRKRDGAELISDSTSLFKETSNSHSCSELVESDNSSIVSSKLSAMNSGLKKYSQEENSEDPIINNSVEHPEKELYKTPSRNDRDSYKDSRRSNNKNMTYDSVAILVQSNHMETSKETCDNGSLEQKIYEGRAENQYNSLEFTRSSGALNKMKLSIPNFSIENNFRGNINERKCIKETLISQGNGKNNFETPYEHPSLNKTLEKEEYRSSVSEPFLSSKMNHHVGYKRISISEIFRSTNTKPQEGRKEASNHHHVEYLNNLNAKDLSPSHHLKLILGIGQNRDDNKYGCPKILNDSTNNAALNKSQPTDKLKTISVSEYSVIMSKNPREQDSLKYPCSTQIYDSTEKCGKVTENHSGTPPDVTNLDIFVSRRSNDKNKKCVKNNEDSLDFHSSNNLTCESDLTKIVRDPVTKHIKKQKRRRTNLRKERSDKNMSSTVNYIEKNDNRDYYFQSNTIRSHFNQKVTSDVSIKTQKSLHDPEKCNKDLLNEDPGKNSNTEQLKPTNPKYYDLEKSIKDNEISMNVSDSCPPTNSGENYREISPALKCNFDSLNSKNMNSSHLDRNNPISNNESFTGSCSASIIDKNTNKYLPGTYSKKNYSESQVTSSKYFRQKRGNKGNEFFRDLSDFHICKSNEKDKVLMPMIPKSDFSKTQARTSENCESEISMKDKGSYSGRTRKKFKKKRNEILVDRCEKRSKIEQHSEETNRNNTRNCSVKESSSTQNQYQRNIAVTTEDSLQENLKTPTSGIATENDSSNSESTSNNLYPNSESKTNKKHLGTSYTSDTTAFSNNVSDTLSREFNERIVNIQGKTYRFKDDQVKNEVSEYFEREKFSKNKKCYAGKYCSSWKKKTEGDACERLHQRKEQKKYKYTNQDLVDDKISMELNQCKNAQTMSNILFLQKTATNAASSKKIREFGKTTSQGDIPSANKHQNYHFEQSNIASLTDISLKSLKNEDSYTSRRAHEIRFVDFLKCCFIEHDHQKTKNRKPKFIFSPSTLRACNMKSSPTSNIDSMKNLVLTVTPEVMEIYRRNKQALNMNLLLDVHVPIFLSDFFYKFEFLKLVPILDKIIELYLSSIIGENPSDTLPLLLNVLSFLSEIHLHWTRDNWKKMLKLGHATKKTRKLKSRMLCKRGITGQCSAYEVLKYWDVLSSGIVQKKYSDV